MSSIESKVAELAAQLEVVQRELGRLLATPRIMAHVVGYETAEGAKALAIAEERRVAAELAKQTAELRARVAQHPWARLVVPADSIPGCTGVEVDAGELGRRMKVIPGSAVMTAPRREIEAQIVNDRALAVTVAAGELVLEAIDHEAGVALEMRREARRRAEMGKSHRRV